ncbi:MAG: phosphotransferase [Planctomycetes bacterium]|nr:phosphotransferase [Planctomycetota bacterium]
MLRLEKDGSPGGSPSRSTAIVSHNDLQVAAEHLPLLRANALDSLDRLFESKQGESLSKPGLSPWRERLRLTLEVEGQTRTFYLKRFTNPPARAGREVRRARCGASSVAGLEWAWLRELARQGIACPQPVAFGEDLVGTRERRSAVLMAAVPGESLERWIPRRGLEDRAIICRLVVAVADLVARLHRRGYVHRDLYLSHLFFDPQAVAGEALHLIDLQRIKRPRWALRRWIIKDLAALHYSTPRGIVSQTDRLRWLKQYLGLPKLNPSARRLIYRVAGKAQRIARHDRRRLARLTPAKAIQP